ncbi:MAG: hypothetical protein HFJ05_10695 [Eubacterium sp.]|nr:hypothetical protein [Eubacterium sp.]
MVTGNVAGKEFYEKMRYGQGYKPQGCSNENFSGGVEETENPLTDTSKNQTSVQMDYRFGRIVTELFMQETGRVSMTAVMECAVRHITYEECDFTRAYPAEGYTLKAKVDVDAHMVYIEQKNEDGTYQAYEVNPLQASEDAKSPIVQTALCAWKAARELFAGGIFTEARFDASGQKESAMSEFEKQLLEFQEYVRKRIKEGPPKIATGGSEFSEEEWEKLIQKIDRDIDAYKEELRERIRKQKEADDIKKVSGGITDTADDAEEAVNGTGHMSGGITGEKAGEGLELSENEALEGIENNAPRGSSLLARFSKTKKAPYSYLADASGKIVYKGVTFYCDDKKNQICLGNMDDVKNVINIPLSKGGCLRVNRENIGDLARAISMFSAEDIGRIMRAIAQDNKAKEVEWELEASRGEVGEAES